MYDPRMKKLADVIIDHSIQLKKDEAVYIEAFDMPPEMLEVLVRKVYSVGGHALISEHSARLLRTLHMHADETTYKIMEETELEKFKRVQAYVGLRGWMNTTEESDVPADKMAMYRELYYGPVHIGWRLTKTRWVVLRWPTTAMAQNAQMSTEGFENLYFDTCTLDYGKMDMAMDPLASLMARTDKVRIVGPGTDLSFSIRGIPVIKCSGQMNLPDGECYTAPVRNSVNGTLAYNTKSIYDGKVYENIKFRFKDGKIIEASSSDTQNMTKLLDTDEGARYIGEFSFGLNPYVRQPMMETLFDEKISGSIHFTPGNSYDDAPNGNRSAVHWDIVLIQTKEWGGGEIYFDDVLVRKDGRFVLPELKGLNPENLI
ncbi:MAG: aminopeptidase [Methanomassiliicoccales archaeon]|nr:aminopeptidase [Methanomassiliicoccales archaeon]